MSSDFKYGSEYSSSQGNYGSRSSTPVPPLETPKPIPAGPSPASTDREQDEQPANSSSSRSRKSSRSSSDEFTGPQVPAQFKLPQDLVASLKLHSIMSNRSMSEIVLECLTSSEFVAKAWISTRRSA